jgi:hypothetical protein
MHGGAGRLNEFYCIQSLCKLQIHITHHFHLLHPPQPLCMCHFVTHPIDFNHTSVNNAGNEKTHMESNKKSLIPKHKHCYKHKEKWHHINETRHTYQRNLCSQTLLNIDFEMQLPYETSAISKLHVKSTYHNTMVNVQEIIHLPL